MKVLMALVCLKNEIDDLGPVGEDYGVEESGGMEGQDIWWRRRLFLVEIFCLLMKQNGRAGRLPIHPHHLVFRPVFPHVVSTEHFDFEVEMLP